MHRLAAQVQAWYHEQIERDPVHYFGDVQVAAIAQARSPLCLLLSQRHRRGLLLLLLRLRGASAIAAVHLRRIHPSMLYYPVL